MVEGDSEALLAWQRPGLLWLRNVGLHNLQAWGHILPSVQVSTWACTHPTASGHSKTQHLPSQEEDSYSMKGAERGSPFRLGLSTVTGMPLAFEKESYLWLGTFDMANS